MECGSMREAVILLYASTLLIVLVLGSAIPLLFA